MSNGELNDLFGLFLNEESATVESVNRCLKNGADVNARDENGDTALMIAACNNENADIIRVLIENGADVNARDEDDSTALICAAKGSNPDHIVALIEHKANVHIKDKDCKTAWDYIKENKDLKGTKAYWLLNDKRFEISELEQSETTENNQSKISINHSDTTKNNAPNIDLNKQFKNVLDLLETTENNFFITGKAGTGKSTLLEYFCDNTEKSPVVVAPTGVAALNVKGETIHKFFGFDIKVSPQRVLEGVYKPWQEPEKYKPLKTLIIDEVSMVRADLFDSIDVFLRKYGNDETKPFGGVQIILFGDLYQLPPVVSSSEQEYFSTYYSTPYFFSAKVFQDMPLDTIELETIFRQNEQHFIDLLGAVRDGSVTEHHIEKINTLYSPDNQNNEFDLILTTKNKKADNINKKNLDKLSGKLYSNKAEIKGNIRHNDYPTEEILEYRINTQIMLLNNDSRKRWVNGDIGYIKSVKMDNENQEYLQVSLKKSKELVTVYPYTWHVYTFSPSSGTLEAEKDGSFTQYPFRLGWAVTIHKSQGKTVDNVLIDLGDGSFATGQTYVALSRCTSFNGVHLSRPIEKEDVLVDYAINEFFDGKPFWQSEKEPEFVNEKDNIKYENEIQEDKIENNEIMHTIKDSIENKTALKIRYKNREGIVSERLIEPMLIFPRGRGRYMLKAYCHKRSGNRVFSIDSIVSLEKQ